MADSPTPSHDEVFDVGLEMSSITVGAGPGAGSGVDAAPGGDAGAASPAPTRTVSGDNGGVVGADHSRTVARGDGFALLDNEGRMPSGQRPWCGPWFIVASALGLGAAVVLVLIASGAFSDKTPVSSNDPKSGNIGPCAPQNDVWRLPTTVLPTKYAVALHPTFVEPYDFSGSVTIDATVAASPHGAIQCVYLNAEDLELTRVLVSHSGGVPVEPVATQLNTETTLLGIRLPWTVQPGTTLQLTLDFTGELNRNMEGLYLSTYSEDGATVPMVATQFEATSARRAFPCFDEPAFKAVFAVTLQGVPDGFTALSNMPETNVIPDPSGGSFRTVEFEPTVRMSSYLVAAVVGKMSMLESQLTSGSDTVKVRVWARTSMANQLSFALETAVTTLEYYNSFFGVPFPLPKCDLVAVPDFAAGAMENWGLVTFRETALLGTKELSSVAELERVAVVVCHELAHQWFGNLVTMQWWDYLWLNEGFATFVEFIGTQASQPSFHIWDQFLGDNPQPAMRVDGYVASHALSGRVVNTPQQIESQFDTISYSKGSSVIRMVAAYMQGQRDGSFQSGLASYLTTYKYQNTVADQLWTSLSTALPAPATGELTLTQRLQSYTRSTGVPVVMFEWQDPSSAATGVGTLVVKQRRFYASQYSVGRASVEEKAVLWWIPLTLKAENSGAATGVAAAATAAAASGGFSTATWGTTFDYDAGRDGYIKANLNQTGYYRVNYPSVVWQKLGAAIQTQLTTGSGGLTDNDRSGLVEDSFAMIYSGLLQTQNVLDFVRFLSDERSFTVWRTAFSALTHLRGVLFPDTLPPPAARQTCINNYDRYVRGLVVPVLKAVGWNSSTTDSTSTVFLRSSAISAASYFGDTETIAEAQRRFEAFKANSSTPELDSNIQSAVFASVVRWGGQTGYDDVLAVYRSTDIAAIKRRALRALAAATTPSLLQAALDLSISDEVRSQDTTGVVDSVAYNPLGRVLAWNFVTQNWQLFDERYGSGGFAITSLVTAISSQFVTQTWLDTTTQFWATNSPGGAELEVLRSQESIGARMLWNEAEAQGSATCTWLAAQ